MKFNEILQQLQNILNEDILNESPITKQKSIGKYGHNALFNDPQDINKIIDRCIEIYDSEQSLNGFAQIKDLILDCTVPVKNLKIHKSVSVVYGNEKLGIKHILNRRGEEFTDKDIGQRLSKEEVIKALKDIPNVIQHGKVLRDFDLKNDPAIKSSIRKPSVPSPYGDRIILDYNDLFYIVLIEGLDGKSDVTCPLTMFRPSVKYRRRMEELNLNI